MTDTTVFRSGNSQAVRLPKEFRFKTKTVEIFRRGDEVVLREKKRSFGDVVDEAFAHLPPVTDADMLEFDAALRSAKNLHPVEERNWALLTDDLPPEAARAAPEATAAPKSKA